MKIIAKKSLNKESKTVYWMPPRSLETSKSLSKKVMPGRIRAWLKSSQEDSLVNRSVLPEKEEEVTMKEICGRSLCRLLKSSGQNMLSWKTSQGFFHLDISKTYFADYMKSGIMQDGRCWALKMWVHHTKETDCGLLRIPTPTSSDVTAGEGRLKGDYKRYRGEDLATYALRKTSCVSWPTPTAIQVDQINSREVIANSVIDKKGRKWGGSLITIVKSRDKKKWSIRIKTTNELVKNDEKGGQLNPSWVAWLMGWPIDWTSLKPMKKILWFDWSVDPADLEVPKRKWDTPSTGDSNPRALGIKKPYNGPGQEHLQSQSLRYKSTGPISRVAVNSKDRVNRLKALGNGQVPLCVAIAWEILITYDGKKKII